MYAMYSGALLGILQIPPRGKTLTRTSIQRFCVQRVRDSPCSYIASCLVEVRACRGRTLLYTCILLLGN